MIAIIGILVALLCQPFKRPEDRILRAMPESAKESYARVFDLRESKEGLPPPANKAPKVAGERVEGKRRRQLELDRRYSPHRRASPRLPVRLEENDCQSEHPTAPIRSNLRSCCTLPTRHVINSTRSLRFVRKRQLRLLRQPRAQRLHAVLSRRNDQQARTAPATVGRNLESAEFTEVRTRDDTNDERGVWSVGWNGASVIASTWTARRRAHPASPAAISSSVTRLMFPSMWERRRCHRSPTRRR